jgi:hypothetical protein
VLLAPRERTKLTAQSVECVFLGYSAEHKRCRCWVLITCRMQTSQDIVFDESHPFYPHPTTDAPLASLPISHLTLLPSESPPVVSDYTVKPHVTQFYSHRGARLSDVPASSDELSYNVPSSFFH